MSAHDETFGNAPGMGGAFSGAAPRTPYPTPPPCKPFVYCDACHRDDEWVNQRRCRACGQPVSRRMV